MLIAIVKLLIPVRRVYKNCFVTGIVEFRDQRVISALYVWYTCIRIVCVKYKYSKYSISIACV